MLVALVVGLAALLGSPQAAFGADYTWSGASTTSHSWSDAANWAGNMAPASRDSLGTVTFPDVAGCAGGFPACLRPENDLTGLTINRLVFTSNDGAYSLGGNGIKLGSGGMSDSNGDQSTGISVPITLGSSQTWTCNCYYLSLDGGITGPSSSLTINMSGGSLLYNDLFLSGGTDNEVGPVSIDQGGTFHVDGYSSPTLLNYSDGHRITVSKGTLEATKASLGPLTTHDESVWPHEMTARSASFDSASTLNVNLSVPYYHNPPKSGTFVSSDGHISLNGMQLGAATECYGTPPAGYAFPLISTTGTLTGQFGNVGDGGIVTTFDGCENAYTSFRIQYHETGSPQTVTATTVFPPDVTTTGASDIGARRATFNGTVTPNGLMVSHCRFEYGTSASYGQSVPCAQNAGDGYAAVPVSASVTSLSPNTTYHFRLVATNAAGTSYGGDVTFGPGSGSSGTLSATGVDFSATAGALTSGDVAKFSDTDPNNIASDYSVSIDWGDGSPADSNAYLERTGPSSFAVSGAHKYYPGEYGITTTISKVTGQDAGEAVTVASTAQIGPDQQPGGCPGTEINSEDNPVLKKLKDKAEYKAQTVVDAGLLSVIPYADITLADARLCAHNVLLDAFDPFSLTNPLTSLVVHDETPGGTSDTFSFPFDAFLGWNHQDDANWSLAPPGQAFSLDWHSFAVKPSTDPATYDDSERDTPVIEDPLLIISGPTLTTQLINGYPQRLPVYLAASLQPQATLGVALSPKDIRTKCALDTATNPLAYAAPSAFAIYIALNAAKEIIDNVQSGMPKLNGPTLALSTDNLKAAAHLAAYGLAMPACESAVRDVQLVQSLVALIAVGAVVATPVEIGAISIFVGGQVLARLQAQAAVAHKRVTPPPATRLKHLTARRLRLRSIRGLQAAPLARADLLPFTRAVEITPMEAWVGHLVVSSTRLQSGRWLTVIGAKLPDHAPHRAELVIRGPGYTAVRILKERHGIAGAEIRLPSRMQPGLWGIAVIDQSDLHFGHGKKVHGMPVIRLGVFRVQSSKKHRSGT